MMTTLYKLIISLLSIWFVAACAPQTETDEKNSKSTMENVSEENGVVKGQFDPNSSAQQTLTASSSSEIASAAISISPSSLAIETEISIEQGSSMVSDSISTDLALGEDVDLAEAGPAVVISSSELVDADNPMSLAIPISASTSLVAETYYVVIYKVIKASEDGAISLGVIPTSELTIEGGKIVFKTTHFGSFQAAKSSKEIAEKKEVRTAEEITKPSQATEITGLWKRSCEVKEDSTGRQESETEKIKFGNDQFLVNMEIHNDTTCTSTMLLIQIAGTYSIGSESSNVEGAKIIDIVLNKIYLTPKNDEAVRQFNQDAACGKTDWTIGNAVMFDNFEVCDDFFNGGGDGGSGDPNSTALKLLQDTAQECQDGPPELGSTFYSIFKVVDDTQLFLGRDEYPHCGESVANRNINLDEDGYTKVETR